MPELIHFSRFEPDLLVQMEHNPALPAGFPEQQPAKGHQHVGRADLEGQ